MSPVLGLMPKILPSIGYSPPFWPITIRSEFTKVAAPLNPIVSFLESMICFSQIVLPSFSLSATILPSAWPM